MPNMLLVDDNKSITSVLKEYAKTEGYEVHVAHDGEEAYKIFTEHSFDIVLLDVMMPVKDGFWVCREIRKKSNVPIIMITARGEDFERIMGLDMGADDYIVKPFSPSEVMARVRAIMRRITVTSSDTSTSKKICIGNLSVDIESYIVEIDNNNINLTKKEFDILWTLVSNKDKVFSRDNLLDSLWGYDYFGDNRTVDTHVKRLRAKLDKFEHNTWSIKTIRGVGYKFEDGIYE